MAHDLPEASRALSDPRFQELCADLHAAIDKAAAAGVPRESFTIAFISARTHLDDTQCKRFNLRQRCASCGKGFTPTTRRPDYCARCSR